MVSEKAVYWMALSVLTLAAVKGLVSEYRGWAGRLAESSIAMVEQTSEMATGYADPVTPSRMNVVRMNDDIGRLVCAQVRLAHVQTRLPLHQAEMIRAQVDAIRVQILNQKMLNQSMLDQSMLDQSIHAAIAARPRPNIVIDVPEPPEPAQIIEHATF